MPRKIKYWNELLLTLKMLVPVCGIIFFDWSIGTIFLYFWFDMLFVAGETILKIVVSANSSIGEKIGTFFRFILFFSILMFFMMIAAGMSFDGAGKGNMEAHFEIEVIYGLIVIYAIEFLAGFIYSGKFKTTTSKTEERSTYALLVLIFIIIVLVSLLFRFVIPDSEKNYVLGIALIVARQAAEYFIGKRNQLVSNRVNQLEN